MLELLRMKAKIKWTDTSVDKLLTYLKDVLPTGNLCPNSVDESKKIVCPLDLPHVRYQACIKDCIIYWKEHAEKTRFRCAMLLDTRRPVRNLPRKLYGTYRSLPACKAHPKEAKLMRWHVERTKPDDGDDPKLRHLVDGSL